MELQIEEIRLEDMTGVVSTASDCKRQTVQIKYEIQDNLPTVLADETRIRQVIFEFALKRRQIHRIRLHSH